MSINNKEAEVQSIVDRIINAAEPNSVVEIYAKSGSIVNGEFGNWVGLMVEINPEFSNESLNNVLDEIEEESFSFRLAISTEPCDMERGHGLILWPRS